MHPDRSVTTVLKREMADRRLTNSDLRSRLNALGIDVTLGSLKSRMSRGTFSATFFLQCMEAIGVDQIQMPWFKGPDTRSRTSRTQLSLSFTEYPTDSKNYRHSRNGQSFVKQWNLSKPNRDLPVISLFTGAGGLDIGLEKAGFRTVACVEIDPDCRSTLAHNRPSWALFEESSKNAASGDVRSVDPEELLEFANLKQGEAALVVGGAPCQPFSNIGKRHGQSDPNNGDLFLEFVRIVKGVQPAGFLFENVKGIAQSRHDAVTQYMRDQLESDYSLTWGTLNAADYGIPQRRERFFLIGHKGPEQPSFPLPTHFESQKLWKWYRSQLTPTPDYQPEPWVTVAQTFKEISEDAVDREDYVVMNISSRVKDRMTYIGPGENFHALPMEMRPNCWRTGKHQGRDTFGRMRPDRPAHTIRTAAYNPSKGQYIHPTEDRGLSSVEMAYLQGFSPDWIFKSAGNRRLTLKSAGLQIGNAVPPGWANAIGEALRANLT